MSEVKVPSVKYYKVKNYFLMFKAKLMNYALTQKYSRGVSYTLSKFKINLTTY